MSAILEVLDIQKTYGDTPALSGVTFTVQEGEMFGLLGPNGAGKTTLLSILSFLQQPTQGQFRLFDQIARFEDLSLRRWIGIGTQELSLYLDLTAKENLDFFGKLYQIERQLLRTRIDEMLEFAGLQDRANQKVHTFSGGMKRRLNLAVSAIHKPKLLLLDEPTTGVDPQSRNHIFDRIKQLNKEGTTVIYTTHYMEEVETLCTRIGIMDHGRLIACDTLPRLLQLLEGAIQLRFATPVESFKHILDRIPNIRVDQLSNDTISIACSDTSEILIQLMRVFREANIDPISMKIQETNLERVFLHLTNRTLRD
jgi:ABC-2 type transport system ATP-binding protein